MTAPAPEALPVRVPGVDRVLVVDDDRDINRLLLLRLERRGYEVVTAESGEEALEVIADTPPDLAFVDIAMPGMSGLDLLARIRSSGLDIGVVMTTAFSSEQTAIQALRQGADDYLRKPFETAEFQVVLERTARRVGLTRENRRLQAELDEKRERLETEFANAGAIQASLLPVAAPTLEGYQLAARCVPANEVGGDFYDWLIDEGQLTFILGDVMGKGMPAALLMASARAAFRAASKEDPANVVQLAARALEADLIRSDRFVTFFCGQIDLATGRFTYVDAGHGYACVVGADRSLQWLEPGGPPFGMFEAQRYITREAAIAPGETLLVFSDGLVEIDAAAGPGDDGVARIAGASAQEAVDWLLAPAGSMVLPDDLTVLALRREPAGATPGHHPL